MSATVLVADDDETVRESVSWVLEREGFRVLTAADGAEAVRLGAKAAVDLFVLDVHMPLLDGAAVLAHLRAKPQFRDTPALFLTGDLRDVPAGGVVLAKPCAVAQLLETVRSLLTAAHRRRARPRNSTGHGTGHRPSAVARR
jgi:CheY-like chemotaxis protein